jgi:hypothetical protein
MSTRRFAQVALAATLIVGSAVTGCNGTLPLLGSFGAPTKSGTTTSKLNQATQKLTVAQQERAIKVALATLKSRIALLHGQGNSLASGLAPEIARGTSLVQGPAVSTNYVSTTSTPVGSSSYRIATLQSSSSGGVTTSWDDVTGQLDTVAATDSTLKFSFAGQNSTHRNATLRLTAFGDGSTGYVSVDADSANWISFQSLLASASVPFQVWYDQYPDLNTLNSVALGFGLVPKGDQTQRMDLSFGASSFDLFNIGTASVRLPTHYFLKTTVPRLALDQTLDIKRGGSTQYQVVLHGSVYFADVLGEQTWNETITVLLDTAHPYQSTITVQMQDPGNQLQLAGTATFLDLSQATGSVGATGSVVASGSVPATGSAVIVSGAFTSLDGQTSLATLNWDSRSNTLPAIVFADGSSVVLQEDANADSATF